MEPEEIAVVLARASELHSKLSDAISHVVVDSASPSSSRISSLQNGDSTSELGNLAAIRDSLEILAEKLDSLQVLQQQQRADRDAGLAEIEESRRLFLKRLKEYRGRELEIVQEALAFAGGDGPDKDELPVAEVYPPSEDGGSPLVSIPRGRYGSGQRQEFHEEQQSRNQVFGFEVEEGQGDNGSEVDSSFEDEDYRDSDNIIKAAVKSVNAVKNSMMSSRAFAFVCNSIRRSITFIRRFVGQISGEVTGGPPSKVMMIAVSTLVVLSLTDLGERRTKSVARVSRMPAHRSPQQHHICNTNSERVPHTNSLRTHNHAKKSSSSEGNNLTAGHDVKKVDDDDFPICVVRERVELPFYQELQTPDVLHGRG